MTPPCCCHACAFHLPKFKQAKKLPIKTDFPHHHHHHHQGSFQVE
jgi:hypothetical protein